MTIQLRAEVKIAVQRCESERETESEPAGNVVLELVVVVGEVIQVKLKRSTPRPRTRASLLRVSQALTSASWIPGAGRERGGAIIHLSLDVTTMQLPGAPEAQIPIIDLSAPSADVAQHVLDAASTHGFLFIKNDGQTIPPADIDAMFALVICLSSSRR